LLAFVPARQVAANLTCESECVECVTLLDITLKSGWFLLRVL